MKKFSLQKYGINEEIFINGNFHERVFKNIEFPLLIIFPETHYHLKTINNNASNAIKFCIKNIVDFIALEGEDWTEPLTFDSFNNYSEDNRFVEQYRLNEMFELIIFKRLYNLSLKNTKNGSKWNINQNNYSNIHIQSVDSNEEFYISDKWSRDNIPNLDNKLFKEIEKLDKIENLHEKEIINFIRKQLKNRAKEYINKAGNSRNEPILKNICEIRKSKKLSKATILNIGEDHIEDIVNICDKKDLFNVVIIYQNNHTEIMRHIDEKIATFFYHKYLGFTNFPEKLALFEISIEECQKLCHEILEKNIKIDRRRANIKILFSLFNEINGIIQRFNGKSELFKVKSINEIQLEFNNFKENIGNIFEKISKWNYIIPIYGVLYDIKQSN